jgi:hypothetical protein
MVSLEKIEHEMSEYRVSYYFQGKRRCMIFDIDDRSAIHNRLALEHHCYPASVAILTVTKIAK